MKIADIQVSLIDHMGSDLSVVNAARVSFDKESDWEQVEVIEDAEGPIPLYYDYQLAQSDAKLIAYLAKHKHFSPFNHAFLTVRVKAPIFVARQLVKHKFMPWNEISRRYVDSEPEFYFPEYWREKGENVKQGSAETVCKAMYKHDEPDEQGWHDECYSVYVYQGVQEALDNYIGMLELGVCPEQARMVLPQNTMTEWYWSGTLGAFMDMLVLRLDPHTQKESRDVAILIAKEVERLFPISYKARMENN